MLNERETEYVNGLFKWDRLRIRLGWIFMLLLVCGGLIFVVTSIVSVRSLNEETLRWITLPGIAVSIALIVLSIAGIQWLKQRHLIASILKKLLDKSRDP
ncbi:MAG TPA: hypothetical protein VMM37_08185 [Bacteroidota bacterium]|nr:hypothetical protein [Bacteroidota bacterium]